MKTSVSDSLPYIDFCDKVAADTTGELLKNFRRNPDYDLVVPGNRKGDEVLEFVSLIKKEYPEMLQYMPLFEKNQGVFGNPAVHKFEFGTFDVPMVLQIYYLALLKRNFGDLSGMRICEIGAGAGLLFKLITDLYPDMKYTFIDLPSPLFILKKSVEFLGREKNVEDYLSCYDILDDKFVHKNFDLITSDCAFNELYGSIQRVYLNKILNHCDRGRIAWYDAEFGGDDPPMKRGDAFMMLNGKDKKIVNNLRVPTIYWG